MGPHFDGSESRLDRMLEREEYYDNLSRFSTAGADEAVRLAKEKEHDSGGVAKVDGGQSQPTVD